MRPLCVLVVDSDQDDILTAIDAIRAGLGDRQAATPVVDAQTMSEVEAILASGQHIDFACVHYHLDVQGAGNEVAKMLRAAGIPFVLTSSSLAGYCVHGAVIVPRDENLDAVRAWVQEWLTGCE